jgi:hypothetical protein
MSLLFEQKTRYMVKVRPFTHSRDVRDDFDMFSPFLDRLETCDAYYTIEEADQEAKRWSS